MTGPQSVSPGKDMQPGGVPAAFSARWLRTRIGTGSATALPFSGSKPVRVTTSRLGFWLSCPGLVGPVAALYVLPICSAKPPLSPCPCIAPDGDEFEQAGRRLGAGCQARRRRRRGDVIMAFMGRGRKGWDRKTGDKKKNGENPHGKTSEHLTTARAAEATRAGVRRGVLAVLAGLSCGAMPSRTAGGYAARAWPMGPEALRYPPPGPWHSTANRHSRRRRRALRTAPNGSDWPWRTLEASADRRWRPAGPCRAVRHHASP